MKKVIKYIMLSIFIILLIVVPGWGENSGLQDGGSEKVQKKAKKRIIGAPIVFYTPETRLAFGGAGSLIFRTGKEGQKSRPSSVSPLFIYTLEKQFIVQLNTDLYFKEDKYRLKGEFKILKYPTKFYGIGGDTLSEAEEAFTSKSINFEAAALVKIASAFDVGLKYHFFDWRLTEVEPGKILDTQFVPGTENGHVSGLGITAVRDTRDNIYFPTHGDLFEMNAAFYKKFIGSDYNYNAYKLDLRKYFKLFGSHVFALQAVGRIQTGSVPFLQMAKLGGPYTMRGYYEGRFIDKSLLAFQAEYRFPVFWRFRGAVFGGFGGVGDGFGDIKLNELKSSYGVGLRFLFDKKEHIYLRMDFGFGEGGSSGFYLSIFEAF